MIQSLSLSNAYTFEQRPSNTAKLNGTTVIIELQAPWQVWGVALSTVGLAAEFRWLKCHPDMPDLRV